MAYKQSIKRGKGRPSSVYKVRSIHKLIGLEDYKFLNEKHGKLYFKKKSKK